MKNNTPDLDYGKKNNSKEYDRERYIKNKNKISKRNKERKEEILKYQKEYREKNIEKIRQNARSNYKRKKNNDLIIIINDSISSLSEEEENTTMLKNYVDLIEIKKTCLKHCEKEILLSLFYRKKENIENKKNKVINRDLVKFIYNKIRRRKIYLEHLKLKK